MKLIIDITRTMQEAPLYADTPKPEFSNIATIDKNGYNEQQLIITTHTGTHTDACSHFMRNGTTIDRMPLDRYVGDCILVTVLSEGEITEDMLKPYAGFNRILLRTGGKAYLTEKTARFLVSCGVITVGTDALSIAPSDNEKAVHEVLLGAEIAIIENLYFDDVDDGEYCLFAAPLKIKGADGSPVRALLIK